MNVAYTILKCFPSIPDETETHFETSARYRLWVLILNCYLPLGHNVQAMGFNQVIARERLAIVNISVRIVSHSRH